jgi:hypothetical protein
MPCLWVGADRQRRKRLRHRGGPLGPLLLAARAAPAQGDAPWATHRHARDRRMGQGRGAVAVLVVPVHIGNETPHVFTQRIINDDQRRASATALRCGRLEHAPEPTAMDLLLAPGRRRENARARGLVGAVEDAAGARGQALVGPDDPAGQRGLEMPTLALVLNQVAADRRVGGAPRRRCHNRPSQHTPPCPRPGIQPAPRVAGWPW